MGGTRDQDLSLGPWGTLGPILRVLSQRQVLHCQPPCPTGDGDVSVPPNMGGTSAPCYLFVSALAAVRVCVCTRANKALAWTWRQVCHWGMLG